VRRYLVVIGIAGVVVGVGPAVVAAIAAGGSGRGHAARASGAARVARAETIAQKPGPPSPRVRTLGITRSATLVSYCWTEHAGHGAGSGVCADGVPGHPAHTLRWRDGATIDVDLRLPAHGVQIQACTDHRWWRRAAKPRRPASCR
jgi:hypothetical protein